MTMPFYVSPDQMMKDRADFARKGINRGRCVVVASYRDGIVFIAENPSHTLHKVSEIHDRIGFAAVGRYHEFENLRVAGIRYADLRGYGYDRADVSARALANSYAQLLGTAFSSAGDKPYEVELLVAQLAEPGKVGGSDTAEQTDPDRIYRISFDGSVYDEGRVAVIGHNSQAISASLTGQLKAGLSLAQTLRFCVRTLRADDQHTGDQHSGAHARGAEGLEVAILDRTVGEQRTFARLSATRLTKLLGNSA